VGDEGGYVIEKTEYLIERLKVFEDTEELAEALELFYEDDGISEAIKYYLKESAIHMRGLDELAREAVRALQVRDRQLQENSGCENA
jgi:hypothetical protein